MIFKSDGKGTDLNGFLDRGSHLQGELAFETTFRIDGRFTGSVRSNGDLIVGEAGEVEGTFEVGQCRPGDPWRTRSPRPSGCR